MKLINKDYAVDTAWSIEVYHGSAREVCEMLEDAPTVEAIPISWIEKHIENAGFVTVLNSHSVEFMLRQWYREQAERKE